MKIAWSIEIQNRLEMGYSIMLMSCKVPISSIYRIPSFYSHGGNVSFSKYFFQQFFGDKRNKSLKFYETQETRKLLR